MKGIERARARCGRPARRAPRGAALLLAMIIVVLVVTAIAGMVWQQTRAVSIEAAERARAQSAWILNGALDWARLILREDQRGGQGGGQGGSSTHDSLDEPWATPLAEARLSTFLAADKDNNTEGGPEAFISGGIADAQARYNLAGLVDDAGKVVPAQMLGFERLCDVVGTASDTASRIAEALRAARTPATDEAARAAPLRPSRLSDLAWAGIEPATLAQLEPYVDLLPVVTAVNANTAPREVLIAAIDGIDPGTAERLVQKRQSKPFRNLDEIRAELPTTAVLEAARIGVSSSYFEVAGRLRLDDRVLEERSLLVRRNNRIEVLRRERRSFSMPAR